MHHWDKAVARSLYWKDNVRFDSAGRCLIPGNEVSARDPYLAMLRRNTVASATASAARLSLRTKAAMTGKKVLKKVVSPVLRYGTVFSLGLLVGYSIY
jgi:hypothetical protein